MARILYLVTEDWYFCSHRLLLARAAKKAGYEIVVVTQVSHHADIIRSEGFRLIPIKFARSLQRPWQDVMTLISILKIYRREQPDIIHHVALKPVVYGSLMALFASRSNSPLIVNALTGLGFVFTSDKSSVGVLKSLVKFILRFILHRKNSHLILQNRDDMQMLLDNHIVDSQQVTLIRGSGVDIREYKPHPETGTGATVMLVARMLKDKGVEEFVAAAAKLRNRGTEARFVLVGDTDPENPSAISVDTLKQWQSEGNIEWWGRREDMVNVYQQAQIIVLPSCREGLPKVLLEAAACGLPIVATDVPGCREIVINNENGMLVPARNVDMLAEAIAKLVNNPELRKQMGAKGRQLVEQEFSSEKVINETLRLYERLLNNKIASSLRSSQ